VYIDQVSIREVLPDGSLGGEQVVNTSADMHSYVEPRAAAAIDYQVKRSRSQRRQAENTLCRTSATG
jgi:hypothetical protein